MEPLSPLTEIRKLCRKHGDNLIVKFDRRLKKVRMRKCARRFLMEPPMIKKRIPCAISVVVVDSVDYLMKTPPLSDRLFVYYGG